MHTFIPGQIAKASEVNENFEELKTRADNAEKETIYAITPKGVVKDIDDLRRKWRIRVNGKTATLEGTAILNANVTKGTLYEIGTFPPAARSQDNFIISPTAILSGQTHYVLIYPSEGRIELEPAGNIYAGSKINFNQASWRIGN